MKKSYLLILATGLYCFAACNKEMENTQTPESLDFAKMITETITASLGNSTKVTIANGGEFAWDLGDNIAVHVSKGDDHKYVTTSGASTAGTSASFTVSYEEGYSRDAFAIFPSTIVATDAANYGQSGMALDVTLPATYTLAEVSDVAPCPMIADNTGSGWTFSHLCGLLRLTVNSIPSDATGIVIQFPGKKVNGAFSIASTVTPGTSTIETATPVSGEDQITVTFAAGVTSATVNLPLPTGDYDDVFITPVGSETKVAAVRHIKAGGYTVQAAHGKKLTTTMVSFTVDGTGKKVIFAPANLVATIGADYASTKWFFHAHQYDMVYTSPSKNGKPETYQSFAEGANIDLFGFVGASSGFTGKKAWGITGSSTNADYGDGANELLMNDWGESEIGDYPKNFWSTPSIGEWEYVFRTRTATEDRRFCKAMLFNNGEGGVLGVILFPDNYVHPDGVPALSVINEEGGTASSVVNSNNYSKVDWEKMEAAGAIFLPSAGYRSASIISAANDYTNVEVPMAVRLRANDAAANGTANRVNVNTGNMAFGGNQRQLGMSVRLVRDLN